MLFGTYPLPKGAEWADFLSVYSLAAAAGFTLATTYLGWDTLESAEDVYPFGDNIDLFIGLADTEGLKVSSEITIISAGEMGGLPAYIGAADFTDATLRTRFEALVQEYIDNVGTGVDYIWIGNEIDQFIADNPSQLADWTTLFTDCVAIIRAAEPTVTVGTIMTYHGAVNNGNRALVDTFGPLCDIIGVTYYPQVMPNGYVQDQVDTDIAHIVEDYGAYPLALIETGTSAATTDTYGTANQVEFCRALFAAMAHHEDSFEFFSWFNYHDFSDAYMDANFSPGDLKDWAASLGLATNAGVARPVLATWTEEVTNFGGLVAAQADDLRNMGGLSGTSVTIKQEHGA